MQSNWEVVLRHLPDASLREDLLLNSRSYDKYILTAAETRTAAGHGTATSAPVESQGTTEVQFQLVDVHGEKITVRAMFQLLLVRRPHSECEPSFDEGFAVVMGSELGNQMRKNGRVEWSVSHACVGIVEAVPSAGSRFKN